MAWHQVFLAVMGILGKGRGVGDFSADEKRLCMTFEHDHPDFSFFLPWTQDGKEKDILSAPSLFEVHYSCFAITSRQSRGAGSVVWCATGMFIARSRERRKFISAL